MNKKRFFLNGYEKDSFLSKPHAGWVEFKPGSKVYDISYWLGNLPVDWLESAIEGMKSGRHIVVGGHQEAVGPVYCVVPSYNEDGYCHVIEPERDDKVEEIECLREEFCEILCNDLEKHIDEWAKWSADASGALTIEFNEELKEQNKNNIQREKRIILNKIEELRILLEDEYNRLYKKSKNEEIEFRLGDKEDNSSLT